MLRTPRSLMRAGLLAAAGMLALPASATPPPAAEPAQAVVAAPDLAALAEAHAPTPVASRATTDPAAISLGDRAAVAASATLAALLPRLASNDGLPLLDRSVLLAGDLSRLLQHYQSANSPAGASLSPGGESTGKIRLLLERATALLGTPYRWGGNSPDSGFDCSGLVSYVFRTALGIELPRVSREMARQPDAELIKDRADLQEGDLVFFGRRGRVDHVGIYVGEGQFVHAPSRGKDVRVDSITGGYWGTKFMQARRVEM